MTDLWIHPAAILLAGGLVLPFLQGRMRKVFLLLVPLAAFGVVVSLPEGIHGSVRLLDWEISFGRVDALSRIFAFIMALMGCVGTLFALLAITTFPVWLPVWVGFWQWVANAYVSLVW